MKKDGKAYNCGNHADFALTPCEETGHEQDDDCHRDCSNCQRKFYGSLIHNDDNKLNREPEEEKEIKFQEGDVDLT